ncbi:MAG: hypothetical protein ACO289_11505, partial [Prochlorococcaceae cyanobacterium]
HTLSLAMFASAVAGGAFGVAAASLVKGALRRRRRLQDGVQLQDVIEQLGRMEDAHEELEREVVRLARQQESTADAVEVIERISRELQDAVEVLERQSGAASERSKQLDALSAEVQKHAEALGQQDSLAAAIIELRQVVTQLLMAPQRSAAAAVMGGPEGEVAMMMAAQQRLQEAFQARAMQRNGARVDPSAMGVPGAGGAGL